MVDSSDKGWLVKRKHYGGGESVVAHKATKEAAQSRADEYNAQYQTDNYIVEKYDTAKAVGYAYGKGSNLPKSILDTMKTVVQNLTNKNDKSSS